MGDEAEYVCRYILNPTPEGKEALLAKVGLANQTTMYKKETQAIGKLFELTMIQKYPEDAKVDELDFILVVGGFDSSNTAHLVEIPHDAGKTVFHINEGDCIREDNSVKHRLLNGDVVIENDWLPTDRPLKIGVTSGASTPDAYVQDALERL